MVHSLELLHKMIHEVNKSCALGTHGISDAFEYTGA